MDMKVLAQMEGVLRRCVKSLGLVKPMPLVAENCSFTDLRVMSSGLMMVVVRDVRCGGDEEVGSLLRCRCSCFETYVYFRSH